MPRDTERDSNEPDKKRSKLSAKKKKHEKRKHKHKKHHKGKHVKHKRHHSSSSSREGSPVKIKKKKVKKQHKADDSDTQVVGPVIPTNLEQAKPTMVPMTKEQWEKEQSVTRRVYDEETGRHRLIKGDGEVLEEIVSKKRHSEINRQATSGDGNYFQNQLGLKEGNN